MSTRRDLSERNTKAEILDAYQKLRREVDELEGIPDSRPKGRINPSDVDYRANGLLKGISTLKITVSNTLSNLESRLIEESKKLEAIKAAIREGTKQLKEIHHIKFQAETLSELRRTQAEEKRKFEKSMGETRSRWEREKREREEWVKEIEEETKKKREREEEEYKYRMELTRRRDMEALEEELAKKRASFEAEIGAKEKELLKRQRAVEGKEEELIRLRKEAEQFPKTLENRVKEVEKEAVRVTEERFKMDKLMLEKEMARMKELNELTVKGLQEKIKEQAVRIQNLEKDLKEVQAQTHVVATKAVEGIARIPIKATRGETKGKED